MELLQKLILAAVIPGATWLGCVLLGGILITTVIPIVVVIGSFLKTYAGAIAILTGVWFFFTH